MSVFDFIEDQVNSRPHQLEYLASSPSVAAMNSLVSRALELASGLRANSRHDRLLFIATALGYPDGLPKNTKGQPSTRNLTQAEVSTLIDWLKDPEEWELRPGIQTEVAEVEKECLKRLGQMEMQIPWE